ncbi:unnamed protein product [Adineta steineri]|uniref:Aryl hydrocarbon receptor n=1 Tax=Adineta steineri TaxID=433720 RepID=A0A814RPF6_9BILA|nr:unnamed protein product [Adineta steineri]CAF1135402.1 unnamed protein product [Adineta steineri]CAF1142134.1 unnamed protein product [Adineta steineri]
MYATKRRRRNTKNYKSPLKENQKTNPSKRHRERLNGELENLASLLPFESSILTKLDKLSILRLAVSYLRVKSYFQATFKNRQHLQSQQQQYEATTSSTTSSSTSLGLCQEIYYHDPTFSEGESILEALQGFIVIVSCDGELFFASRTVEQYLGFHQSDILHQSAYELIHSEDRDEFKRHLQWNEKLTNEHQNLSLEQILTNSEHTHLLERTFTVRFRCLLDNTSGFVTLEIDGRIGILYGQKPSHALDDHRSLALFGIACPFGPPSLFEIPQRESLFKSKYRLTLEPVSLDPRGKLILNYTDHDLTQIGSGYNWIHSDDLKYYSTAHKELLKTGTSGLVCYRIQTKDGRWQWLQSSMRIIYKSNKPDFVIANHRPLTDDEGEELFYKRGTEFKLPYPCLYDFDTNFNSNINDDENYSLKHHSTLINKNSNTNLSISTTNTTRPTKKVSKTTIKQQTINPFTSNSSSTSSSSFDPYYNTYPSAYVSSYPTDVTTASFIEAATNNYTTNPTNTNDLLLVNETNPYSGTYANYYTALQQQYHNSLTPYHAVYYQDTNNRYYTNHRTSPSTINEQNYHQHHHQQQQQHQTHENYLIDTNNSNNPYSYYLYNKNPPTTSHGHDSNNNLSLFDVSLPTPIHHSVIKHSTKR